MGDCLNTRQDGHRNIVEEDPSKLGGESPFAASRDLDSRTNCYIRADAEGSCSIIDRIKKDGVCERRAK